MEGQANTFIASAPQTVYDLVSDITRMGEWSPECISGEWLDGATGPAVGAKFKGTNKLGFYKWSTSPVVTAADPGKVFEFNAGATTWRYEFTPVEGGTSVTESFVVTSKMTRVYSTIARRRAGLVRGMAKTLERIKTSIEM